MIAVEPELASDLAEGFAAGERTAWSRELTGRTIADGLPLLHGRRASVGTYRGPVDDVVTVSEESIVEAMRWLAETTKLIVEPSGAVATAAVLDHPARLGTGTIAALVTGGNIDLEKFASLVAR